MGQVVKLKRTYTEDEIADALVVLQANGGKYRAAARNTGIAEATIRAWAKGKRRETKTSAETENRANLYAQKSGRVAEAWGKVRDLALRRAEEQLAAGEKLQLRDLGILAGIGTDKVNLLTGKPTERHEVLSLSDFLKDVGTKTG